eukprot:scaffold3575_cov254-Pinguiococcus_pyrenoidosus.AAC.9
MHGAQRMKHDLARMEIKRITSSLSTLEDRGRAPSFVDPHPKAPRRVFRCTTAASRRRGSTSAAVYSRA